MSTTREMSVEEFFALPEDFHRRRHELLDGEHVVSPPSRLDHQRAVMALYERLRVIIGDRRDVELLPVIGAFQLNARTVAEPDLFLLSSDPDHRLEDWRDAPIPMLVAEVLSPSTAHYDRGVKRRAYLDAGVEEFWIVDLDARHVERWRPGDASAAIIDDELRFELQNGIAGSIELVEYFAGVLGSG